MLKDFAASAALAALLGVGPAVLLGSGAWAQAGLSPGERAGGTVVPSTHTPGCGGILCDADDPRRQPGAPPPPPCEGLICGLAPYGMAPPVTAAEAQRMQEERARAAAAAAAATPVVKPTKHIHRRVAKAHKTSTMAARSPDPGAAAAAAPAAK